MSGGTYCFYKGCRNRFYSCKGKNIKFFRFPKDSVKCKLWIKLIGREYVLYAEPLNLPNFYKRYRICSKHFRSEMYMNILDNNRLLPNAVPIQYVEKSNEKLSEELSLQISGNECLSNIDIFQETSKQVDSNHCSNVPIETVSNTESEVKLEDNEKSWRSDLLLENQDIESRVDPNRETCMTLRVVENVNKGILDLFNHLWTGRYAPILPSRAWAIHFIESADDKVICFSKLLKIGDNVICGKKIVINRNSIKLYVCGKLFEIENLNLISSLICIQNFQSILKTFDNSMSIYDFQHYGTNDFGQNVMPLVATDIKVEPDIKIGLKSDI